MIVGPKQPSRGRDARVDHPQEGLLPERGYAAMGALLRRSIWTMPTEKRSPKPMMSVERPG